MEQCNKARVLLAEDESTISNFIKVGMADFGIDVTVVDNGLEAWSTLQAQEQDIKLIHTITGVGYMMSCREPNATSKKK